MATESAKETFTQEHEGSWLALLPGSPHLVFRLFRQFGNKTSRSGCVTSSARAAEELVGRELGQERPETEKWDSSRGTPRVCWT